MKIIISHDIDHLSVTEHKHDLFIPKFIVRSIIHTARGRITFKTLIRRLKGLMKNEWDNLGELIDFDKKNNVASTFFFGMSKGLGLSYSVVQAEYWVRELVNRGFDTGIHGIEFNNVEKMLKEQSEFRRILGFEDFGIRMHYLRKSENTFDILNKLGYKYDTTEYGDDLKQPYFIDNMLEVPLHIMDSDLLNSGNLDPEQCFVRAAEKTIVKIEEAKKIDGVLNILFHPIHFLDSFPQFKKWYIWLINYCNNNNIEFISYRRLVDDLSNKRSQEAL